MNYKEEILNYKPQNEQETVDREIMLDLISKNDDLLFRDNRVCHFTASSWIVNKNKDKVLMIFHNIYNSWAWTGGHADGDEDLLFTAKREAEEETGIKKLIPLNDGKALSLEIINVNNHIKNGKYVSDHLHLNVTYGFIADENDVIRIKEDENSNVAWFNIDEAVEKSSEEKMQPLYKKLNDRIKKL